MGNLIDSDQDGIPDWWEMELTGGLTSLTNIFADDDNDLVDNYSEYLFGTSPIDADSDDDELTDGYEIYIGSCPLMADTDQGGVDDGLEIEYGMDPTNSNDEKEDFDGDGETNEEEINQGRSPYNNPPPPVDSDKDGMPDAFEINARCMSPYIADSHLDSDNDGFTNLEEYLDNTDPCYRSPAPPPPLDTDGDGMPDEYEISTTCLDHTVIDAHYDYDQDGKTNLNEYLLGTDPCGEIVVNPPPPPPPPPPLDTDGDGMPDFFENLWPCLDANINDADGDADGDGVLNINEYLSNGDPCTADPVDPDPDNDGVDTVVEDLYPCLEPTVPDAYLDLDEDGIPSDVEIDMGLNPCNPDTDGDGMVDGWEVQWSEQDPDPQDSVSLDPFDPLDANQDYDNDGLINLDEFHFDANPWLSDAEEEATIEGPFLTKPGTGKLYIDLEGKPLIDPYTGERFAIPGTGTPLIDPDTGLVMVDLLSGRDLIVPGTGTPIISMSVDEFEFDSVTGELIIPDGVYAIDPATGEYYVVPGTGQIRTIPGTGENYFYLSPSGVKIPYINTDTGLPFVHEATGEPYVEVTINSVPTDPQTGTPLLIPGTELPYVNVETGIPYLDPNTGDFFRNPLTGEFMVDFEVSVLRDPSGKPYTYPGSELPYYNVNNRFYANHDSRSPYYDEVTGLLIDPDTDAPYINPDTGLPYEAPTSIIVGPGDGMPDDWEAFFGLDAFRDRDRRQRSIFNDGMLNIGHYYDVNILGSANSDNDTLTDLAENGTGTLNQIEDTDMDGMPDDFEVRRRLDPLLPADPYADLDDDGISDLEEYSLGTHPNVYDTDRDGMGDGFEIEVGANPLTGMNHLVAWWPFEASGSGVIYDEVGFRLNARMKGIARLVQRDDQPAFQDFALQLRPADDTRRFSTSYALVPDDPVTQLGGDFSLAIRFKPYANVPIGDEWRLVGKGGDYSVSLIESNGISKVRFAFYSTNGGTSLQQIVSNGALTPSEWNHILIRRNEATGQVNLYINGQLDRGMGLASGAIMPSSWPLLFGSYRSVDYQAPQGEVDDIRIYSALLDPSEIVALAAGSEDANSDANSDSDNDSLTDLHEYLSGTNPLSIDTDMDGLTDWQEVEGVTVNVNGESQVYTSEPRLQDTDGDGLSDFEEAMGVTAIVMGQSSLFITNPDDRDTDGDGLSDYEELFVYFTNPNLVDTDLDEIPDGWEADFGLNPTNPDDADDDQDQDGQTNKQEYLNQGSGDENVVGNNPNVPDTFDLSLDSDNDGLTDWDETFTYPYLNPNNPNTLSSLGDQFHATHNLFPDHPGGASAILPGGDPDGDGRTNEQEKSDGTDPNSPDNTVYHALAEKSITKRPKQEVSECDEEGVDYEKETFQYGSAQVKVYFPEGSSAHLAESEHENTILVLDTLILEGGGQEARYSPTGSASQPWRHVGSSPKGIYTYSSQIDITGFLSSLERDDEGYVTFTIRREAFKELVLQDEVA